MARLKLASSTRGSHLKLLASVLVLLVVAIVHGGWRLGLGASVGACPACSCTSAVTAAAEPEAAASLQEDERGSADTSQDAGATTTGSAAATEELLCGGPDAIPRVDESLAASTAALWPNAADAFKPWQAGFTDDDIEATARNLGADKERADIRMYVTVRNNRIVFPRQADVCDRCNGAVFLIKEGLDAGLAAGRLRIPEGLPMLWNVEDFSQCPDTPHGPCKAPLFSVFKNARDLDVLAPHFKPRDLEPHWVPWERKRDLAFFRGASICSYVPLNGSLGAPRSPTCSRWAAAQMSWDHPELLNATIMFNVTQYGGPQAVEGPPTSHEEQAHYKYLLNVDGSTAAWRLATLMMKNSLVIKQASPDVEWYYHAVKPCEHYINYWVTNETDLIPLLRQLKSPGNQEVAQRIAANANAFAYLHLGLEAQWRYWQLLIDRYIQLYRPGGRGKKGAGATAKEKAETQRQQAKQQQAAKQQQEKAAEKQPGEPQQESAPGKPKQRKEVEAAGKGDQGEAAEQQPQPGGEPADDEKKTER